MTVPRSPSTSTVLRDAQPIFRLAPSVDFQVDETTRTIRYVFSNDLVARDQHTVASDAWDLTGFMSNPVFLFAHLADELPIGRVTDIETRGGQLVGSVHYIEPELYPFADTVYQLVKARYLNAVSTSWIPRAGKASTDRSRQLGGGMDFSDVELLEISQVPVPAVPGALAIARKAGIDTGPIYQWAERTLDSGGLLMIPRTELETLRRDAKTATPRRRSSSVPRVNTRGMYAVANLASLLGSLGYLQADAAWEAELEGDGSPVPAELLDALKALGKILVEMTIEEVNELVGDTEPADDVEPAVYEQAAKTRRQRVLRRMVNLVRNAKAPQTRADRQRAAEARKRSVNLMLQCLDATASISPATTTAERRRIAEERRARYRGQ
jgi:hypothetical protein